MLKQKIKLRYKSLYNKRKKTQQRINILSSSIYNNYLFLKTKKLINKTNNHKGESSLFKGISYFKKYLLTKENQIKMEFVSKHKDQRSYISKRVVKKIGLIQRSNKLNINFLKTNLTNYKNLKRKFALKLDKTFKLTIQNKKTNNTNKERHKLIKQHLIYTFTSIICNNLRIFTTQKITQKTNYNFKKNIIRLIYIPITNFRNYSTIKFKILNKQDAVLYKKKVVNSIYKNNKYSIVLKKKNKVLKTVVKKNLDYVYKLKGFLKNTTTTKTVYRVNTDKLFNEIVYDFKPIYTIDAITRGKDVYKVPYLIKKRNTQFKLVLRWWSYIIHRSTAHKLLNKVNIELINLFFLRSKIFSILNFLNKTIINNKAFKHYRWW